MAYFYATDMSMIAFIPKIAFSCLLVLSSINILNLWFVSSYSKMRQKEEWLVVPLIVAFYFMFDMLRAVALGVALSTFIFVASFYRTGTVKLMSTGEINRLYWPLLFFFSLLSSSLMFSSNPLLYFNVQQLLGSTIRSTVARTKKDAEWLNKNGDLIQILVLQNYLFFGNASSCLNYIEKIFGENSEKEKANGVVSFPLIPKYLIIDLSLVTGIDASTADVFSDAFSICKANSCCLFLVGVTSCIKSALTCGGFKPGSSDRYFRFISNLEAALGRAEDGILTDILKAEEIDRRNSVARRRIRLMSLGSDSGFGYALEQIDQQHELAFAPHLLGLEKYVYLVEIEVGQYLYRSDGGVIGNNDRGLFFIETGLLVSVNQTEMQ
jgi:MFS superfamily sulfate permease-like transporter